MTRRTARFIWAALVATPFLCGVVAWGFARAPRSPAIVEPVFWAAVAASALNLALSRVLPPRLGPAAAQDREAVAFTRLLVGFALCDAAAMAPLVAFMVTRDLRLLGLVLVDVVALLLLFPSDARWDRLRPGPFERGGSGAASTGGPSARPRGVRRDAGLRLPGGHRARGPRAAPHPVQDLLRLLDRVRGRAEHQIGRAHV